jgi:transcriptional regulator with XRE-family HTH domain
MESGILSNSKRKSFLERLKDPTYRHAIVAAQIGNGIALQIRSMRKAEGWDQAELATKALGKPELQSMISRYENPDYRKYSMSTLLDLAKAFDVGLEVRFVPFSRIIQRDRESGQEKLTVESFQEELKSGTLAYSGFRLFWKASTAGNAFYRPDNAGMPSTIKQNGSTPTSWADQFRTGEICQKPMTQ